ncbi:MAG: phosphopantetheine-binding protein [Nitrospirota bacterium]|nr:phosphopantetheine-binding protein [Nitrospirota bacterium]
MEKETLIEELKALIIKSLKLEDVLPSDIDPAAPLFGSGLGLDSIDALELVVALEKTYGIRIPDEDVGKEAFASLSALAGYVIKNKK